MVAAKGREHERTRDSVAVVGKVHQKPGGACADQAGQNHLVVDETVKAIPERDRVRLLIKMLCLLELAGVILFVACSFEKTR